MDGLRRFLCVLLILIAALIVPRDAHASAVNWSHNLTSARQTAQASGRLLLLKFTADWCGYCKKMERTTFADQDLAELVNRQFIPVLIDADQHADLVTQLNVAGLPALLVATPDMQIVERISGYRTADKLSPLLQAALAQNPVKAPLPSPQMPVPARPQYASSALPRESVEPQFDAAPRTTNAEKIVAVAQTPQLAPTTVRNSQTPSFDGLCLASVVGSRAIVKGSPHASMVYRGQTLWFRDQQQRDTFRRSPRKYWPMMDGICGMTLLESGRRVPGRLENAAVFRKQIWLFRSREQMTTFISSPQAYIARFNAAAGR